MPYEQTWMLLSCIVEWASKVEYDGSPEKMSSLREDLYNLLYEHGLAIVGQGLLQDLLNTEQESKRLYSAIQAINHLTEEF